MSSSSVPIFNGGPLYASYPQTFYYSVNTSYGSFTYADYQNATTLNSQKWRGRGGPRQYSKPYDQLKAHRGRGYQHNAVNSVSKFPQSAPIPIPSSATTTTTKPPSSVNWAEVELQYKQRQWEHQCWQQDVEKDMKRQQIWENKWSEEQEDSLKGDNEQMRQKWTQDQWFDREEKKKHEQDELFEELRHPSSPSSISNHMFDPSEYYDPNFLSEEEEPMEQNLSYAHPFPEIKEDPQEDDQHFPVKHEFGLEHSLHINHGSISNSSSIASRISQSLSYGDESINGQWRPQEFRLEPIEP